MGIFSKSKTKTALKKPVEEKEEKTTQVASRESGVASEATSAVRRATDLLSSPRVSEKAAILTSSGTYVFNVPISANKITVRKAVEKQYKVNVVRVNMVRGEGKIVRRGRISGRRSDWKKALVTLKTGQKIELHPGV